MKNKERYYNALVGTIFIYGIFMFFVESLRAAMDGNSNIFFEIGLIVLIFLFILKPSKRKIKK